MSTTPTPAKAPTETTAPKPKKRLPHLGEAVGWLGAGLALGTVLSVAFVLWRLEGDDFGFALLAPVEGSGTWQLLLVMAVIVVATVFFRNWSEPNPDPLGRVTSSFFVFLGTVLTIVLFLVWTGLPHGSFVFTARLFEETYSVVPEAVGHWGLSLPFLVGVVLLLISSRWPRTRPWKRWPVPFAVGVVLALIAAPAVRALSEYVPTEHTFLAEAPAEPAPYPATVSRLGWEWQAPEGTAVVDVERGPLGPVIAVTDGLVGLDGQTGEELWSYRQPLGDVSTALQPGADRAHVVLRSSETEGWMWDHEQGGDRLRGGQVTVLDTATGEVVTRTERVSVDPRNGLVYFLPELTLLASERDMAAGLEVRGTDEEGVLWDFSVRPEEGAVEDGMVCGAGAPELHSGSRGSNLLVQGDQVLFGYMCADPADFDHEWEPREQLDSYDERFDARLVSFDLRTGEENWRRAWPDVPGGMNRLWLSSGGPVLHEGADPVVTVDGIGGGRFVLLDAADGSDLLDLGREDIGWRQEGSSWSVLRADSGGAVVSVAAERQPDQERGEEDRIFHRLDPSGEVVATVRLPLEARTGERSPASTAGAVALMDGVALPFMDEVVDEVTDERALSLVAAPFQDTDPGIGVATPGAGVLEGAVETWAEPGRWDEDRPEARAVLVPGAVVSFATDRGERVYGWQP